MHQWWHCFSPSPETNQGIFRERPWMPGCSMQLLPLGSPASTEAATAKVAAGRVQSSGPDGLSAKPGRSPALKLFWKKLCIIFPFFSKGFPSLNMELSENSQVRVFPSKLVEKWSPQPWNMPMAWCFSSKLDRLWSCWDFFWMNIDEYWRILTNVIGVSCLVRMICELGMKDRKVSGKERSWKMHRMLVTVCERWSAKTPPWIVFHGEHWFFTLSFSNMMNTGRLV